jgi:type IV pilus assembly protein PilB
VEAQALTSAVLESRPGRLIGDVVVELGFATREKVEEAVELARAQGKPTGQVLVEQSILRHDQLARVVAERYGLDYVDLSVYDLDMGAVNLIDMEAIRRYQAVPIGFLEDGTLLLAMADPTNVLTVDDVAMLTARKVRAASASIEDVNILITRLSRIEQSVEAISEHEAEPEAELMAEEADTDAPVIKLVHSLVAEAIDQGASDIHIDPTEGDMRVLFRIDGVLSQTATLKRSMAASIVSRVKIMSEMDISERRVPQDGRFALTVGGRRVDVRVTTLPLVHGEGAYMRILDKGASVRDLEALGMQRTEQDRFAYAINRPNGAVLVTGPA